MNLNKVMLIGRLTRDPEIKTTTSGQNVAKVSIATNRVWNDKGGQKQEKTEFHNIVIWGRLAEIAGQYLSKGQEVYFEGRLQTEKYTGKDGIERRTTEIVAESMQMGSRPAGTQAKSDMLRTNPIKNDYANVLSREEDEISLDDVPF